MSYLSRQIGHIRKEGWTAVFRKTNRAFGVLLKSILVLFCLPLAIIIRLIRPIKLIRLGYIHSDIIGHFVFDTEYYLRERKFNKSKSLDFFYFYSKVLPNDQWVLMVKRHLRVFGFIKYMFAANKMIPGGNVHVVQMQRMISASRDKIGLLQSTAPCMTFSKDEIAAGEKFLVEIGLNSKTRFVCLIVRDSAYKNKYQSFMKKDWSYHDYRDSDIDTYEESALALANKGYAVFRMGKAVNKPFKARHPMIFDYASSKYRSDFLDIWLAAHCDFCISTGTGLDNVSNVYKKPIVYVNFLSMVSMVSWHVSITVPKHLRWRDSGSLLTFKEHLENAFPKTSDYEKKRIDIVDLSSQEINDAVMEMEQRLSGNWIDKEKDIELQKEFWKQFSEWKGFKKSHGVIHPEARIGSFLLSKNYWLG